MRAAALILCLALCLWLMGARAVRAESAVIDLAPPSPGLVEPDADGDPGLHARPTPSYRVTGPRNLQRVSLSPWPPVQGQTLTVWIVARRPVTLSAAFLGLALPVRGASGAGWSLAPIPPLQKPGYASLTIRAGAQELVVNVPVRAGTFETINIPTAVAAPILSQTAKVNAEASRMAKLFAAATDGAWWPRSGFVLPLRGPFPHTSAFGSRRTYGKSPTLSAHAGEDFSAAPGTPVYAPAPAVVVLAEKLFVRGNAVVLDHGNGVYTGYWHLSQLTVKPGARVKPGDLLGKVGSTGLSTGAHLHWEMRVWGVPVDPLQWVE